MKLGFEYEEDKDFFAKYLAKGKSDIFEKKFLKLFDFRDPKVKREEFNRIRNFVYKELSGKDGEVCKLKIHPDCSNIRRFEVDHIVPLSTNQLNKTLRKIKRIGNKKVPAQSFGSNHISNLRLSCRRCNAYKKHNFYV